MIYQVLNVKTDQVGSLLSQAATAGATSLYVVDITSFADSGNLTIGVETVGYTKFIDDANNIERLDLATALINSYVIEEPVYVSPTQYQKTLLVTDGEIEHSIEANSGIWIMLADGPRDEGTGEFVLVENGRAVSFAGKIPQVLAEFIANLSANIITTGAMSADRINGGSLTLGGSGNGNGSFLLKDSNGNTIVVENSNGIYISKGGTLQLDLPFDDVGINIKRDSATASALSFADIFLNSKNNVNAVTGINIDRNASIFDNILYYNGSTYTNQTQFGRWFGSGNTVNFPQSTSQYTYFGRNSGYSGQIYFGFGSGGTFGVGYTLVWEYYQYGVGWTQFTPATNQIVNATVSGWLSFGGLVNWYPLDIGGITNYWIRVKTTSTPSTFAKATIADLGCYEGKYLDFKNNNENILSVDNLGNLSLRGQITTPETWQAPTLLNSWVDYGGTFAPSGYRKLPSGEVLLRGLIKNGTGTAGTVLCTLPVGYRPSYQLIFNCISSGNVVARVDVNTNGDVTIQYISSTAWLSLNGMIFMSA